MSGKSIRGASEGRNLIKNVGMSADFNGPAPQGQQGLGCAPPLALESAYACDPCSFNSSARHCYRAPRQQRPRARSPCACSHPTRRSVSVGRRGQTGQSARLNPVPLPALRAWLARRDPEARFYQITPAPGAGADFSCQQLTPTRKAWPRDPRDQARFCILRVGAGSQRRRLPHRCRAEPNFSLGHDRTTGIAPR